MTLRPKSLLNENLNFLMSSDWLKWHHSNIYPKKYGSLNYFFLSPDWNFWVSQFLIRNREKLRGVSTDVTNVQFSGSALWTAVQNVFSKNSCVRISWIKCYFHFFSKQCLGNINPAIIWGSNWKHLEQCFLQCHRSKMRIIFLSFWEKVQCI